MPYQAGGRVQQKARTREALVVAARALIAGGATPSVEEVAAAASISRTTAYRYFPTQQELLVAAYPEIGQESVLGDDPPADVRERFEIVLVAMERQITSNEGPLRTMLRLSLEHPEARGQLPLRKGRRRVWIADALAPLSPEMTKAELDRLVLALTAATGIEAFIWLRDVAQLSRRRALDVMRYSAETLLEAALSRPR